MSNINEHLNTQSNVISSLFDKPWTNDKNSPVAALEVLCYYTASDDECISHLWIENHGKHKHKYNKTQQINQNHPGHNYAFCE